MNLKLKRPLAFFDLETTGLDIAKDRIVEISILKVSPDGKEETYTRRINPTIPMSKQASEITGITDSDLKDMPTFKDVAPEIVKFLDNCDIAGYNSNKFDIPLLAEEFIRAEIDFDFSKRKIIDVQVIYHKKEQRTLKAAYKFYCDKDLENAHSAEADTYATYEILKKQIERYNDLGDDVNSLSKFSFHTRNVDFVGRIIYNDNDVPVFNFGKYKGKPVAEVLKKDPGYYGWMMNADFPLYTKKVLTKIRLEMNSNLNTKM
jgi:DNA polymerase-3 subunit epsilon